MDKKTIKVATYNILLARYPKDIIRNIMIMKKKGVVVFCLQEVSRAPDSPFIIDELLKHLGNHWQASYHVGNSTSFLDFGTGILWDTRILKLKKAEKILPPTINRLAFHELVFHKLAGLAAVTPPRRAIGCVFEYNNTSLTIASIHLDSVGGIYNRMKQLRYLIKKINNQSKASHTIICGDFNSFDLLKTGNEKKSIQSLFDKAYIDASKDILWSADLYRIDTPKKIPFFVLLIKALHIHIKRKLDYIWVKNFKVVACKTLDLPGSDHLAVFATLALD